ncbi:formyltransferase family protein [Candidatus Omnitrophota bacterium]
MRHSRDKRKNNPICIAGKNNVACDSLLFLANINFIRRENIFVLPNLNDSDDNNWMRSLRKTANAMGIKVLDKIEQVYETKKLIFISLEFDQIIDINKFDSKELFNIHFSKLPAYKGTLTSVWPILNGESSTGVSLHKIDNGIDTGDIIGQIEFQIQKKDTSRDLYFKFNKFGYKLFRKNIYKILLKRYKTKPQSCDGSSYYSRKSIDYSNLKVNLEKTALDVHNQIRAFIFPEYQLPKVYGDSIIMSEVTKNRSRLKPGKIVSSEKRFIKVSTIDYDVILYKKLKPNKLC